MDVFSVILTIVYIVVGLALVWFVVELALTMRKVRTTVTEMKAQLDPTLDNVDKMVAELQPTIGKVDPLVDRVTLTVDSVNLELMRVDGILESLGKITGGVSKTVDAVDSVTSAPLDIVTNMTKKVRSKFRPRYASEESVDLGSDGASSEPQNPFADFVDATATAAADSFREESEKRAQVQAERQEAQAQAAAVNEQLNETKRTIVDSVEADTAQDAR